MMKQESTKQLTQEDIKVGHIYSAKKSQKVGICRYFNDRQVLNIGKNREGFYVQYDSPSLKIGRHYPKVPMEKFLAWANEDVTEKMPDSHSWRSN